MPSSTQFVYYIYIIYKIYIIYICIISIIDLGWPYISARLPTSMLLSTVVISNSLYHIHITYKSLSGKFYAAPLSYMHRRQFQVDVLISFLPESHQCGLNGIELLASVWLRWVGWNWKSTFHGYKYRKYCCPHIFWSSEDSINSNGQNCTQYGSTLAQ